MSTPLRDLLWSTDPLYAGGAEMPCHLPHWTGGQTRDGRMTPGGFAEWPHLVADEDRIFPELPAVYRARPYPMHVVSITPAVALVRLAHPGGTMKTRYDYDDHVRAIAGPTLDQQERMTELRRLAIALIGTGALAGLLLLTIAIVQIVTGEAR